MGRFDQVARVFSEGINGYLRGTQIQHGLDREKKEDDWRDEQRTNQRADRERSESERRTLIDASKPLETERPNDVLGDDEGNAMPAVPAYRVGTTRYDTQGEADMAAAAGNTPEAASARLGAAYRSIGKPLEAVQLDSATTQAKAAKFTLDKGMQEHLDQQFDKRIASITDPTQLAGILSKSPMVGGKEVSAVKSADGKTVDLVVTGDDGQQVKIGQPIPNSAKGVKEAIIKFSQSMKPGEKISALQHIEQFDEQQRQFDETKRIQQEQFAVNKSLQERQIGISGATLGLAREKHDADLKNDPMRNLPPVVKLSVGGVDKALAGIDTAITKAQAENQWDPKAQGAKELLARQAALISQRNTLIKPYLEAAPGAGSGGKPSYEQFIGAAPASAGGKAIAAAPPGSVTQQPGGAYAATGAATGGLNGGRAVDPVQAKYDEWQAAKSAWYRQKTPTSAAREKQLEAEYEQMIRNPR